MNILKHIFPVPKLDAKRIVTFSNESDYISFRYTSFRHNKLSWKLFMTVLFCLFSCLKILMGVYIYRNHVYDKGEGCPKSIELKEIGPRFELRLYQVLYTRFILFLVHNWPETLFFIWFWQNLILLFVIFWKYVIYVLCIRQIQSSSLMSMLFLCRWN